MEINYVDELMQEVDANIKELSEVFKFLLKYNQLFRGSGVEFAGLRDYIQGEDDATRIDWKSSLRANKLYVKQYEEEKNLDIYILVDSSSSMLFGTQEKLKSEYAAIVAGSIAFAAIDSGDAVGFGMFADKVHASMPPGGDISQYYMILKSLVDPQFYGGPCDFKGALSYVLNSISEKTALFIISDFIGIGEDWKDPLKAVCGKLYGVFGIMIRDVVDSKLPEGVGNMRLSDPFYPDNAMLVNLDHAKREYDHEALIREKKIESEFTNSGAGFIKVYTNQAFATPLVKYLQLMQEH